MRKTIPAFPKYEAGKDGLIYSKGRALKGQVAKNGYVRAFLRSNGKTHTVYVHRIICATFNGPCPDGHECRHLDNDRQNNSMANLEWATKKENEQDKLKFGTIVRGEQAKHSVLTERIVRDARKRAANGERFDEIARSLSINPKVMADAITGRRWSWLDGAVKPFTSRRKFTDDDIRSIREMAKYKTQSEIAASFGVCRQAIGHIARREAYAHVA